MLLRLDKQQAKYLIDELKKKESICKRLNAGMKIKQKISSLERNRETSEVNLAEHIQEETTGIEEMGNEIERLKNHADFTPDQVLDELRQELANIEELEGLLGVPKPYLPNRGSPNRSESPLMPTDCPICNRDVNSETRVFCCAQCHNWLCGECLESIRSHSNTCPVCRCNLRSRPMQRNQGLERILRQ